MHRNNRITKTQSTQLCALQKYTSPTTETLHRFADLPAFLSARRSITKNAGMHKHRTEICIRFPKSARPSMQSTCAFVVLIGIVIVVRCRHCRLGGTKNEQPLGIWSFANLCADEWERKQKKTPRDYTNQPASTSAAQATREHNRYKSPSCVAPHYHNYTPKTTRGIFVFLFFFCSFHMLRSSKPYAKCVRQFVCSMKYVSTAENPPFDIVVPERLYVCGCEYPLTCNRTQKYLLQKVTGHRET